MTSPARVSPSVRRVALGAAAVDVIGGLIARRGGLVGEPFLIPPPGVLTGPLVPVLWGTALSGPLAADVVLLALGTAADSGHPAARRSVRWLGVLRLVGVLSEPATWGRRRPQWTMALSGAQLIVAAALIDGGR